MTSWYSFIVDSVRAFKQRMKMGQFADVDPEEQKKKEEEIKQKEKEEEEKANSIKVGNRYVYYHDRYQHGIYYQEYEYAYSISLISILSYILSQKICFDI